MLSKNLILSGIVITLAGVIGIALGIIGNFPTMGVHAAMGALGLSFVLSIFLVFVGLAVLIIGLVKFFREKNRPK